jgi:hypothetical protein
MKDIELCHCEVSQWWYWELRTKRKLLVNNVGEISDRDLNQIRHVE